MYVKRVCYPIKVLGPGNRIGIWLAGCNRNCPGCMSPELQTTDGSKNLTVKDIKKILLQIHENIDGVTISGGEPFLQVEELHELIRFIHDELSDDIIVYTGYTIEKLKQKGSAYIDEILSLISVLIDGEYIDEKNDGIGIRGSSNQRVHILKKSNDYDDLVTKKRELQTFRYNGQILIVGIQ